MVSTIRRTLLACLQVYKQWGATTSPSEDVTYPIPVSRVLCLLLTTRATTFRYSPWPTKITTKSFQAVSDCEPVYWFLVAKQQWGVVKGNGVSQTFPLAFATRCFAVAVTANIGSSRAVASSAWDVNKTSAIFYADITNAPSAGWYYAIGVQQWGVSTTSFPLSVSEVYSINASKKDTGANSVPDVQNYSSTGFAYYGPSPYAWFAICKAQQWGVTGNNNVLFPVTFSQSCYIVNCNGSDWGSSGGATSAGISIQNITLQSFAVYTWERGPFRWLALGKQQWGYVSHNNVRSDTPKVAVFPISFTKTIYTISTQLHMTNVRSDLGTGPYIVSYSNNQMSILFNIESSGVIMDGAWWLVIGR